MPKIRNVSDRDLEFAGVVFPFGKSVDVSDEVAGWLVGGADGLAVNPNFAAVQSKADNKADNNDAPEG